MRYRKKVGCYLRAQLLRETLKIIIRVSLVSKEVPRFHGRSLWHSTPRRTQVQTCIQIPNPLAAFDCERSHCTDSDSNLYFLYSLRLVYTYRLHLRVRLRLCQSLSLCQWKRPFDGQNGFRTHSAHQTDCHHRHNVIL